MADSYTKESLCVGMLEEARSVAKYMREKVRPRLAGVLSPTNREILATGIFLRSLCWMETLNRRKQWPSSPQKAAHRRDSYRVSDPDFEDPVAFEKLLSRVEDSIAPLFKSIDKQLRGPYRHEWESVFICIAVQWIRVPAFRPTLLRIADGIHQRFFAEALKTPESWAAWLKKLGVAADASGAHYDKMVEFERGHQYTLSAEPEWFLYRGFKATDLLLDTFKMVSLQADRVIRGLQQERGDRGDEDRLLDSLTPVFADIARHFAAASLEVAWGRRRSQPLVPASP